MEITAAEVARKLVSAASYFLFFAIPFGLRKLVWQFTEGFNEYNAVFLYFSDIVSAFIICCFIILFFYLRIKILNRSDFLLSIFLTSIAGSVFLAYSRVIAAYDFARFLILIVIAIIISKLIEKRIVDVGVIFATIACSGVFQAMLGIYQFVYQKSLGLWFLGEPFLNTLSNGVAKIDVGGDKVLRAYGTMPHPNVLSAFLLLGLFSFYYLWLKEYAFLNTYKRALIILGISVIILGLILAFSRAAWIVGIIFSAIFFITNLCKKDRGEKMALLVAIVSLVGALGCIALRSYIVLRASVSVDESAVTRRLDYNKLAFDLIKSKPLGVGIGNQVIYSVREGIYQKMGMNKPYMWEPVHNLYLLALSELGVLGFISFLIFLANLLSPSFGEIYNQDLFMGKLMLSSLLMLGLFDHYLWTIQSGRLMLWLIVGIVMGINSAHGSTDRAYPSEG